jgi:uncharacterized membrane protein (GlpM family)
MCTVIYGVTKVSKKWGNELGGLLASLPWVAGPIMVFITIEQGVTFAKSTISGIMIGLISWLVFCFAYMYLGEKFKPLKTLLLSYLSYLIIGFILIFPSQILNVHMWFLVLLCLVFFAIANYPKINILEKGTSKNLKYDTQLRMVTISLFVIGITYFAQTLGPTWSGILTPFPVMTSVLAFFTHYTEGIQNTKLILRGMLGGILGFTSFLYSQYFLLGNVNLVLAISIGLFINLVITFFMGRGLKRYYEVK